MNSKAYLTLFAILCVVAVASAQSSSKYYSNFKRDQCSDSSIANPIESLQSKASSIAANATNTSPSAPTSSTSAGINLTSNVFLQLALVACAFVASTFFA